MADSTMIATPPDVGANRATGKIPARAWYTVWVLALFYAFAQLDRLLPNLLLQAIKVDLRLSDTAVSLLSGLSFAIVYSIVGIPLGKLADQWSRRGVISLGIALWGLATTVCGAAASFAQFFAARMGVGFGEAALVPASYSLVADIFPPHRRARAMGIFIMGGAIGTGMAMLGGAGAIAAFEQLRLSSDQDPFQGLATWRLVLGGAGIVTLVLSPLVWRIADPPKAETDAGEAMPFLRVLSSFWEERRAYGTLLIGIPVLNTAAAGFTAWAPALLMRTHDWSIGRTGLGLGVALVIGGVIGSTGGGWVSDAVRKRTPAAPLFLIVAAAAGCALSAGLMSIVPDAIIQLGLMACVMALMYLIAVLGAVAFQEIAPANARAQFTSVFVALYSLVGVGFGPTAVALLTDFIFRSEAAVGFSIASSWIIAFGVVCPLLLLNRRAFVDLALSRRTG